MKRTWRTALAALLGLGLIVGCGGPEAPAAEAEDGMSVKLPAVPQNTSVDSVMSGLVDEAAHGLWALSRAGMAPPESETDWAAVEEYAIQLIASGDYITYGNASEGDANWVERTGWKAYSQDLADTGVMALDAAIRRDMTGVLAAGDNLVTVCESCHQEYRLAPPFDVRPDR
jgi:ABC-type glycerol-3-phosphate transport system substrate-binding protein